MRRTCSIILLLAAAPVAIAQAAAGTPAPPAQLGLCAACHGEDGHARIPGAPNLAGQPYQYLLQALHEYRNGERSVPVMRAAAGPLTEKDMQALARWFSAQSPCKPGQAGSP
ncbi:MAG TPA: cytochrome c [Rhodanobacteraceae bacterium]|jgi:cytochrome c553|nr:cytochrome c [Rhodanobacteraceae bacterium]